MIFVGVIVVIALILFSLFLRYFPILLWISARVSGVKISLLQLFLMRIRNVPPQEITRAMIEAHKAGLLLTRDELEAHYLAGGHVEQVCMPLSPHPRRISTSHSIWPLPSTLQGVMSSKRCRCLSTPRSSIHLP